MERLRFEIEPDDEEALSALLWMAGCEGVSSSGDGVFGSGPVRPGCIVVDGYFATPPDLSDILAAGFPAPQTFEEPTTDWLAVWRASAVPIPIGDRIQVEPGEPEADREPMRGGRRRILVPARAAFGTGSHETTRLMLDNLDRHDLSGRTMLDVGCGSGILSFVALALGAKCAHGFEIDLESALLAGQNARMNTMHTVFWAGTLDAHAERRYDLVVVNVLPERIFDRAAELVERVAEGGSLWYAGHLLVGEDQARAVWEGVGLRVTGRAERGEWGLLELAR
jgi:ribosomal protein L11 methyltransferase